jgi:CheY-like chemotaxis protein
MADFDVEVAVNGAIAIQRLQEWSRRWWCWTLHLPMVGGIRVLQHIRSDPRLAQTRVLVATANDRLVSEVESQADVVLIKPIGINKFRQVVQQLAQHDPE